MAVKKSLALPVAPMKLLKAKAARIEEADRVSLGIDERIPHVEYGSVSVNVHYTASVRKGESSTQAFDRVWAQVETEFNRRKAAVLEAVGASGQPKRKRR